MAIMVAAASDSSVPELNGVVAKLEKTSAGVPTVATRKAVVPPSMARPDFAKAKPNSAMMKTGRMAGRITDMAQEGGADPAGPQGAGADLTRQGRLSFSQVWATRNKNRYASTKQRKPG